METWSDVGDDKEMNGFVQKKNTAHRNLIQKIEAILASYELQEKYSTKITSHSLVVIEQIIKTKPEFFRTVESTFIRNINNGEIDANDIPYIISIITQLYNLLISMNIDNKIESISDTISHILKFLISVIIREQLVKIENETTSLLLIICCENIVDACIKILKLSEKEKDKKYTNEFYNYSEISKETPKETLTKPAEQTDCCC